MYREFCCENQGGGLVCRWGLSWHKRLCFFRLVVPGFLSTPHFTHNEDRHSLLFQVILTAFLWWPVPDPVE